MATTKKSYAADTIKKAADKVKTDVKKTVASTAKTAPEASVFIEYQGSQFAAKAVLDQAVKSFEELHKDVEIKTIELYVKPEEGAAYYVVNGEGSDDYRIEL